MFKLRFSSWYNDPSDDTGAMYLEDPYYDVKYKEYEGNPCAEIYLCDKRYDASNYVIAKICLPTDKLIKKFDLEETDKDKLFAFMFLDDKHKFEEIAVDLSDKATYQDLLDKKLDAEDLGYFLEEEKYPEITGKYLVDFLDEVRIEQAIYEYEHSYPY